MEQVATKDGGTLALDRRGDGPPLLLIHGAMGTADEWTLLREELAPENHVISYDLRNHGSSRGAAIESVNDHVHDLRAIRETVTGSPAIVGMSLGAYIALAYVADGGDARGLVLIEGPGLNANDSFDIASVPWLADWPWEGDDAELTARLDHAASAMNLNRAMEHRKYQEVAPGTFRQLPPQSDLRKAFEIAHQPWREHLRALEVPTTIVLSPWSRFGLEWDDRDIDRYTAALQLPPSVSVTWAKEAGHNVVKDAPAFALEAIRQIL